VVVRKDGSLSGSNNDWYGFTHNILEFVPDWRADAGPVAVNGRGGGSRAVVYGLMVRGAREIRLCNRTHARALNLGQGIRRADHGACVGTAPRRDRWRCDAGQCHEPRHDRPSGARPALDKLPKSALVNDIIYIPRETPADRGGA
jgi:shikimate dehydrogenase